MVFPLLHRALALLIVPVLLVACENNGQSAAAMPADTLAIATDTVASDPAPQAQSPRDRAPAQIRGIYINAYAAGSGTRLPRLIALADSTELNAFVIDVKDERGIRYRSDIELAMELSQPQEVTIRNLSAMLDTLKAHGIYTIARIVVFKDPILSKAHADWSVRTPAGGLWMDRAGNSWVSPWDDRVWDYNISIAEEGWPAPDSTRSSSIMCASPSSSEICRHRCTPVPGETEPTRSRHS